MDPPEGCLTVEEKRHARAIKAAIESPDSGVKALPDYDYAHLAIACDSMPVEAIVEIAHKLQCFREMYNIQDTMEDGIAAVLALSNQHFGFLLEIGYLTSEQGYWAFVDFSKFFPSRIATDKDFRNLQAAWYYMYRAMASNLPSIRHGIILVIECEGMTSQNVDLNLESRGCHELIGYYPTRYKETYAVHAPMVYVVLFGLVKRFLNIKQLETFHITKNYGGYDGRWDLLFQMPTPEIAQKNLLVRLAGYLRERYDNEKTFSLD